MFVAAKQYAASPPAAIFEDEGDDEDKGLRSRQCRTVGKLRNAFSGFTHYRPARCRCRESA